MQVFQACGIQTKDPRMRTDDFAEPSVESENTHCEVDGYTAISSIGRLFLLGKNTVQHAGPHTQGL